MKYIIALLLVATITPAQAHGDDGAGWLLGGIVLGNIMSRPAPPQTVYVYPPQPQYRMYAPPPRYITHFEGNQCPIVDGVQTVPILQTNRYGYMERVGCGTPGGW
jgi:hypothetical protein